MRPITILVLAILGVFLVTPCLMLCEEITAEGNLTRFSTNLIWFGVWLFPKTCILSIVLLLLGVDYWLSLAPVILSTLLTFIGLLKA